MSSVTRVSYLLPLAVVGRSLLRDSRRCAFTPAVAASAVRPAHRVCVGLPIQLSTRGYDVRKKVDLNILASRRCRLGKKMFFLDYKKDTLTEEPYVGITEMSQGVRHNINIPYEDAVKVVDALDDVLKSLVDGEENQVRQIVSGVDPILFFQISMGQNAMGSFLKLSKRTMDDSVKRTVIFQTESADMLVEELRKLLQNSNPNNEDNE